MTSNFKATTPDTIEFSMTITMNLKAWRELRNQVSNEWPGWDMRDRIESMIRQAEETFYQEAK